MYALSLCIYYETLLPILTLNDLEQTFKVKRTVWIAIKWSFIEAKDARTYVNTEL